MIPIYVINLARSPARRAWMERELAAAGVSGIFVRAVDGKAFSPRCADELRRRSPAKPLSAGEAGLILSHRKVWRRLLASDGARAIVLEDDVHLGRGFSAAARQDWRHWRFDFVKLETMSDRVWLSRRGESAGLGALHRMGSEHHGSAAYVVSREGALKALAATRALREPIDISIFGRRAVGSGAIRALQLAPAVAVQHHLHPSAKREASLASTLSEVRGDLGAEARALKPRGLDRLRREAARIAEQALRLARLAPTMRRRRVPYE